ARADGIDALGVRLDGDLRAVARLARDAADLDESVGDLRNLELEQRLDQLRIAAREDHLRTLRPRADLRDHGLDARALLVALAVDLLGAREQRLDLAEVDEHVVAVAGLLDDARHDLAHAVDVLVVHHPPLLLADPLQDDLLRGLRGDAAEALGRDVLADDLLVGDVGPVDVEVVVGDERVLALDDLLAHVTPSSIRLARTISAYGIWRSPPSVSSAKDSASAEATVPFSFWLEVLTRTRRPCAAAKWSCRRSGRSTPGEDTSTLY